ncbi:MAG: hypothetical protein ABSF26_22810 [Thermoguttaceae bacterium]
MPLKDLQPTRSDANRQLIADYAAWFHGELQECLDDLDDEEECDDEDDESDEFDEDEELDADETQDDEEFAEAEGYSHNLEGRAGRDLAIFLLGFAAFVASYGAVLGAAVIAMPWARWAACITACVGGALGAVVSLRAARRQTGRSRPRLIEVVDVTMGLVHGVMLTAFFAALAVAFIGALAGGLAAACLKRFISRKRFPGTFLKRLPRRMKSPFWQFFPGISLMAAACGMAAQAFYLNRTAAAEGLWLGAVIGLGGGLLLALVILAVAIRVTRQVSHVLRATMTGR